ncbi:MAG TPA: hypothetical protein PKC49_04385 [Phycisphaerae bacterium]|nr:hypothetical protein [Phycisphaerae bacterium]
MRKWFINRWTLGLLSGGVLLQATTSCADAVTATSSLVTAGGVIYIVSRILQ